MATRVTTAQLGEKLDRLVDILSAQAIAAPVATTVAPTEETAEETSTIKVDAAYLTHQKGKSQAHSNDKGQPVVLYCRVNKAGETKLAYALVERYNDSIVNQPSHRGEVARFTPQS